MKFFHDILLTEGWEKGERSGERDRVKGEKGIKAWAGRGLGGWGVKDPTHGSPSYDASEGKRLYYLVSS